MLSIRCPSLSDSVLTQLLSSQDQSASSAILLSTMIWPTKPAVTVQQVSVSTLQFINAPLFLSIIPISTISTGSSTMPLVFNFSSTSPPKDKQCPTQLSVPMLHPTGMSTTTAADRVLAVNYGTTTLICVKPVLLEPSSTIKPESASIICTEYTKPVSTHLTWSSTAFLWHNNSQLWLKT